MNDKFGSTTEIGPRIGSKPAKQRRPGPWLRLVLLGVGVAGVTLGGALMGHGFAPLPQTEGTPVAAVTPLAPAPATQPTAGPPAVAEVLPIAPAPAAPAVTPAVPAASLAVPAPTPAEPAPWPVLVEERFDQVSASWPEVTSMTWSSSYHAGRYQLLLFDRPGISYSAPLNTHDFQLRADVQIARGRAGLFFLIDRPNDFYRFLIDTEGRYQLEWQQVGVSQPLIGWTESDALLRGAEAVNQIEAQRVGDTLSLYANGTLLTTYTLPAGNTLESRVGLALDAPEGQRDGLALFDNLFVRAPAISSTD